MEAAGGGAALPRLPFLHQAVQSGQHQGTGLLGTDGG